jgi:hypothetical protein
VAPRPGLSVVGDAIDRAKPAPQLGRRRRGARDEEEQRELPLLPAGCPVKPVGKLGQVCFYLDELGQLISLNPRDHGKTHIQSLFGRKAGLCHQYWPRYGAPDKETGEPKITGWMPELAAEQLQSAAAHEGLFDPQGKVRGRGAWRDHEGEIVLHCGDQVYRSATPIGDRWEDPGKIDGFIYPSAPAMPRPDPAAAGDTAGIELLEFLRCWYWERPKLDPYLLFGAIGHFPFGGACTWRSHVWVTGDTQTGKSTLEQKLLGWLFEGLSLRCHDATEAALRQVLGQQTLPVFFDELEADTNNDRGLRVIKLARLASSGGVIFRGGSDHKAAEFTARSSFYFTSILMPPLLEQDRNRMAILELKQIPPDAAEPMLRSGHTLERARIVDLGRRLRRRVIDQWHRYEATLAAYRQALARKGHRGRSQDQFGTLLAFADLLLYDHEPELELLEEWGEALRADILAETADSASDSEEACEFLARSMLQLRGGDEPEPLTRFLERAVGRNSFIPGGDGQIDKARKTLEDHGLRIVAATEKPAGPDDPPGAPPRWGARDPQPGEPIYLAIANSHEALARMFRDKRWAQGVWSQTFARAPGAIRRVQVKFAGKGSKATLVPIAAFLDAEEGK